MADEPVIALPEIEVSAQAPDTNTGRRDHDAAYETQPPARPATPAAATQRKPSRPDDTVVLVVAGQRFAGWQDVRIVRGMEVFPSHFVLRLTEKVPSQPTMLSIDPGQTFKLFIGADLVMSGYIDTYQAQVKAGERGMAAAHDVMVIGRSGTEDLVDCACGVTEGKEAEARMTFSASSLLVLANDLAAPFGITVTAPDGEGTPIVSVGDGIPQFTVALGQCAHEVLEPIARWKQRILLDGVDGNLVLAKVGSKKAASGFSLPGTVISAQVGFHKQDRFTVYLPALQAFDSAFDVAAAAHLPSANYFQAVKDEAAFKGQPRLDGKARYRPRFVISEQAFEGTFLAELRAKWQKARDYGRSQAVTATVSLWRDQSGILWAPNTLAPIDMPVLKLKGLTWLITQVAYVKGFNGGTRSVVTLMPAEAFDPEPTLYTPYDPHIAQASGDALARRAVTTANGAGQVGGSAGQG